MKKNRFQWDKLTLGVCYYPEHWNESLWSKDLDRMKKLGIETIRIGEFAWTIFEPVEGEFTFDFFDNFLELAKNKGMKVIMGTPTATPPAWLTHKYPEVLNQTKEGTKLQHGGRRHYNYNSPVYLKKTARIVEAMVKHYGMHPSIIGWQIDNEMNCELDLFYSESDDKAFRAFLKKKYGTLESLNNAWGAVFWNQTYTDWNQVHLPGPTVQIKGNPHQELDYYRFISNSLMNFASIQSDIIEKYKKPGDFVTTNGMFKNVDNHKMSNELLNVYTYDSYPNFAYLLDETPMNKGELKDRESSAYLSEVRSICPHFGIMEQQSGANGWTSWMEAPAPKPGQLMLWTMQSIAHGADFISYFRWRTATKGTEIYWHGLLDYDNLDNRKTEEVAEVHKRMQKIQGLAGSQYIASVAIVKDYDNVWDGQVDVWHKRIDEASQNELFIGSQLYHTPIDYLYIQEDTLLEDLSTYRVLIYPHPAILDDRVAKLLEAYVKKGGHLILGCRTGYKDLQGQCRLDTVPGLAKGLTDTYSKAFTLLGHKEEKYIEFNGHSLKMPILNEVLMPLNDSVSVLGTYGEGYYKGQPGIVEKSLGNGKVIYFGSTFTRQAFRLLMDYYKVLGPYEDLVSLPEACELAVREKEGYRYFCILNYGHTTCQINLKTSMIDLDSGEDLLGVQELKAYETKVYKLHM